MELRIELTAEEAEWLNEILQEVESTTYMEVANCAVDSVKYRKHCFLSDLRVLVQKEKYRQVDGLSEEIIREITG